MRTRTIALTGVSGVGKSTFVRTLATAIPLAHLQASAMIQEGRNVARDAMTPDQLRLFDLDENQRSLVAGFRLATASKSGLIILDAHTLIEKDDKLFVIDATVFREIGINAMIFLEDDPKVIYERRHSDKGRIRPLPNVDRLGQIQDLAREQALAICRALNIVLHVYHPYEFEQVAATLMDRSVDGS